MRSSPRSHFRPRSEVSRTPAPRNRTSAKPRDAAFHAGNEAHSAGSIARSTARPRSLRVMRATGGARDQTILNHDGHGLAATGNLPPVSAALHSKQDHALAHRQAFSATNIFSGTAPGRIRDFAAACNLLAGLSASSIAPRCSLKLLNPLPPIEVRIRPAWVRGVE